MHTQTPTVIQETHVWDKYFHLINSSLEEYAEFPDSDRECACHVETLNSDLDVWRERGGISRDVFETAKNMMYGGVLYQILNHQLYRQRDCMFGARYIARVYIVFILDSIT